MELAKILFWIAMSGFALALLLGVAAFVAAWWTRADR